MRKRHSSVIVFCAHGALVIKIQLKEGTAVPSHQCKTAKFVSCKEKNLLCNLERRSSALVLCANRAVLIKIHCLTI